MHAGMLWRLWLISTYLPTLALGSGVLSVPGLSEFRDFIVDAGSCSDDDTESLVEDYSTLVSQIVKHTEINEHLEKIAVNLIVEHLFYTISISTNNRTPGIFSTALIVLRDIRVTPLLTHWSFCCFALSNWYRIYREEAWHSFQRILHASPSFGLGDIYLEHEGHQTAAN